MVLPRLPIRPGGVSDPEAPAGDLLRSHMDVPDPTSPTPTASTSVSEEAKRLHGSLPELLRERFGRGLSEIARGRRRGRSAERLLSAVRGAVQRLERRAATPLRLGPPPGTLPIAAAWDSLGATIAAHPVVVVQGATGSGKSTQIPRLCAALGRGIGGRIAVTQPRRLAARAIATRIAEECGVELGTGVGWRTRFERRDGPATRIEVMTDGVLAAGLGRDPRLREYDTVIVDEAHERSLVVDLLLGSLKRAVEVRDDLRVVVASATLAAERFSRFFGKAPVVEIPGRQHPVEILHRPVPSVESESRGEPDREAELLEATAEAIDEALERQAGEAGDVLVFLPTTRAIDDLAESIAGRLGPGLPLLPLHARLDAAAQDAAFRRPSGPRVILATNVAETSLTLPWVRSVVDTGLARVRCYDPRRRIARLRVEPIAQANAAQRAGRCGRVGPGTCIRLYSEEDLAKRPEFMPPEILRTGLAGVMLDLAHRRLPEIERFPWVDPPAAVRIEEARRTLRELGALEPDGRGGERLNDVAARLARLPLDPRLARIIDGGIEEGCLAEAIVIATALAAPEIRVARRATESVETPPGREFAIDAFRDPRSDLLSTLRIWRAWSEQTGAGGGRRRKWCRRHGLRFLAMREWEATAQQVAALLARRGRLRIETPIRLGDSVEPARVHRAALRGLLGTVASLDREEDRRSRRQGPGGGRDRDGRPSEGPFLTVDGVRASIWPGSTLARQTPRLVVAAEVVETGRRWLRTVAPVRPGWIERFVPHLLVREHFAPHWVPETGQVAASERVRFGEVVLVRRRQVPFGPIDPVAARQVFIQAALVEGRLRTRGDFLRRNRGVLERLAELEARTRQPRASLREEAVFEFYDRVVPASIHSGPSFERWRRRAESTRPEVLRIRPQDLAGERPLPDERDFPDELVLDRIGAAPLSIPIRYRHDPGGEGDGLALEVPVEAIELLDPQRIEWLVPGRLEEKVAAILRGLPKALRIRIHPMREVVSEAAATLRRPERFGAGSLFEAIAHEVEEIRQVPIDPALLAASEIEDSLRFLVEIRERERILERSRDVAGVRRRWATSAREGLDRRGRGEATLARWTRDAIDRLPDDPLPIAVAIDLDGRRVEMHPALVLEGVRIALRLEPHLDRATAHSHQGLRRLFRRAVEEALAHHLDYHPRWAEVERGFAPVDGADLVDAVCDLVCERAFRIDPREIRDRRAFDMRCGQGERDLYLHLDEVVSTLAEAGRRRLDLVARLEAPTPASWREAVAEIVARIRRLDPRDPAFVPDLLPGLVRHVEALSIRLDRLRGAGPERDRLDAAAIAAFESRLAAVEAGPFDARCRRLRVLVEELHVATFADRLGTSEPISPPRLERAFEAEGVG